MSTYNYIGNDPRPVNGQIPTKTVTAPTYNVAIGDQGHILLADATSGTLTINLPAVTSVVNGFSITVKKIDSTSNSVILDGNSSETINSQTSITISNQWDGITVTNSRSAWFSTSTNTVGAGEGGGSSDLNTNNYAWFGGGGTSLAGGAEVDTVQRYNLNNDTINSQYRATMPTGKAGGAGFSSSSLGWFAAGSGSPGQNSVFRIAYISDTETPLTRGSLSSSITQTSGASNGINGYVFGGYQGGPISTSIEKIILSADTSSSTPTAQLDVGVYASSAISNGVYSYFSGRTSSGYTEGNKIRRFTFSNDTTNSVVRASLQEEGGNRTIVGNSNGAWFAGGYGYLVPSTPVPEYFNRIERFQYANDTEDANIRSYLTVNRAGLAGTTNGTYGWFTAGTTTSGVATNIIDRIDFSSDTTNAVDRADMLGATTVHSATNNSSSAF